MDFKYADSIEFGTGRTESLNGVLQPPFEHQLPSASCYVVQAPPELSGLGLVSSADKSASGQLDLQIAQCM